jgi:hypothetical protein
VPLTLEGVVPAKDEGLVPLTLEGVVPAKDEGLVINWVVTSD